MKSKFLLSLILTFTLLLNLTISRRSQKYSIHVNIRKFLKNHKGDQPIGKKDPIKRPTNNSIFQNAAKSSLYNTGSSSYNQNQFSSSTKPPTNQYKPSTNQYKPSTNQQKPSTNQYKPSTYQQTPSTYQHKQHVYLQPSKYQYKPIKSFDFDFSEFSTDESLNSLTDITNINTLKDKANCIFYLKLDEKENVKKLIEQKNNPTDCSKFSKSQCTDFDYKGICEWIKATTMDKGGCKNINSDKVIALLKEKIKKSNDQIAQYELKIKEYYLKNPDERKGILKQKDEGRLKEKVWFNEPKNQIFKFEKQDPVEVEESQKGDMMDYDDEEDED